MEPATFRIKFLILITLPWTVSPLFAFPYLLLIDMFTVRQMLDFSTSPFVPLFVFGALISSFWYFYRYSNSLCTYLQADNYDKVLCLMRAFPLKYWSVFTATLIVAPVTVMLSAEAYSNYVATPLDWFRIILVAIIVAILIGLPVFFLILDLFGEAIGKFKIFQPHVTIKTKVFLIGALVPLLIDTMLIQYYWVKTGIFNFETIVIWITLELLAVGGSLIFVKSFNQSLQPLNVALDTDITFPMQNPIDIMPKSTDELGVLSTRYKELLDELYEHQSHLEDLVNQRTKEMQYANNEMEAFSYSVSHDLRTPLRAINSFSQIITMEYAEQLNDDAKHLLTRININAEKMARLIDDLLMLSRLGRMKMNKTRIDISEMVRSVVQLIKQNTQNINHKIYIEDDLEAKGDRRLLEILLTNLIDNAIKYSRNTENPKVYFGFDKQKEIFFIKDNGIGFSMEYKNKIFQPFNRLHDDGEYEGTGIGLATVKRVIDRHNGHIWVESSPGTGTSVLFTFDQNRQ